MRIKYVIRPLVLCAFILTLAGCASNPVLLNYDTGAGIIQPNQYISGLRFGFVTFQDDRMVPLATGNMKMIGWGGNTYDTNTNVAEHVTRSFMKQYQYLGFKAVWIQNPPVNFSFSSRDWVRALRLQYPNVDVFVIGKIKDYQFQDLTSGYIPGTGGNLLKSQVQVEAYYVNSQDGRLIWGSMIHHRSMKNIRDKDPVLVAPDRMDTDLRRVILDFADRSVPHLDKSFPGAIQVAQANMGGKLGGTGIPGPTIKAINPNKTPIPAGKGRLVVSTTPAGAKVYIDGIFYGDSPMMLDLTPGVHLVKVRMDGYVTVRNKVGILDQQITPWEERIHKKY